MRIQLDLEFEIVADVCFSVWKPLRGPVRDWPLAVCDAQSVNIGKDFMDMDNIMPDSCNVMDLLRPGEGVEINVVENTLVHYSPHQRWYYLSDQETSELLLFRQVDSSGKPGKQSPRCIHSSPY